MKTADKFERLPDDYTFGLELEFTGGLSCEQTQVIIDKLINKGLIREGWTVHYDNSVVDENNLGAEIVSPVLKDDEQTKRELEIITMVIRESGGVMTEKDGGHIHFGVQCLGTNIDDIKEFFKLYTIFEPLLYKLSTGDLSYVRPGCKNYAKPIQKRLTNVIDGNIKSLSELMTVLSANVGANPTHYGENRYYGFNIQRIVEAIRNKDPQIDLETFLQKMFSGEPIYDKDGKKLSPTIEMRYRNGSTNPDEILTGVRMAGGLIKAAKDTKVKEDYMIKTLYRNIKKRAVYVFDKVLNGNREDPAYADCETDEEIMGKKFKNSPYGNGVIAKNLFVAFINTLNPDIRYEEIEKMYNMYQDKLTATEYKPNIFKRTKNYLINLRNELMITRESESVRQLVLVA